MKTRKNFCTFCGLSRDVPDGMYLKTLRQVSLRSFARAIGVTPSYICDIEHNRRNCPSDILEAYLKQAPASA